MEVKLLSNTTKPSYRRWGGHTVLDVIGDGTGMIALMLEDDQVRLLFIETRNGLASFPAKPFRSKTIHSQVKTVLINSALFTPAWDDSIDN